MFSWTVLDDSTLVVDALSPERSYLIKLFEPIPGLQFSNRLGFESKGGIADRFCRDYGYVVALGTSQVRGPVASVRLLTASEVK